MVEKPKQDERLQQKWYVSEPLVFQQLLKKRKKKFFLPSHIHAVDSIHLRGQNTERWNGVTVGLLSSEVDTMSRCQPMHPTERLFKKQTLSGKPTDRLTRTRFSGRY